MEPNTPAKSNFQRDGRIALAAAGLMMLISAGCSTGSVRNLFSGAFRPATGQQQPGSKPEGVAFFRSLKRSQPNVSETGLEPGLQSAFEQGTSENSPQASFPSGDPFLVGDAMPASATTSDSAEAASVDHSPTAITPVQARSAGQVKSEHQKHLARLEALLMEPQSLQTTAEHNRQVQQRSRTALAASLTADTRSYSEEFDSMLALFANEETASEPTTNDIRRTAGISNTAAGEVSWTGWEQTEVSGHVMIRQTAATDNSDEEIPDLTTLEDLLGSSETAQDPYPGVSAGMVPATPVPPIPSALTFTPSPQETANPAEKELMAPELAPAVPPPPMGVAAGQESAAEVDLFAATELPDVPQSAGSPVQEAAIVAGAAPSAMHYEINDWSSEFTEAEQLAAEPAAPSRRRVSLSLNRVRVLQDGPPESEPAGPPRYRPKSAEVEIIRSVVYSSDASAPQVVTGQMLPDPLPASMVTATLQAGADPGAFSEAISRNTWGLIAVSGLILMLLYLPGSTDRQQSSV